MTVNDIVGDARVARVRELKKELAEAKARLQEVESERNALKAHFDLALVALRDFEQLGPKDRLLIIDGWNAILRYRNVSKLTSEDISKLKAEYLAELGIGPPGKGARGLHSPSLTSSANAQPLTTWIVFDGAEANSYRSGPYRVTYTGGMGPHRADRLILDYVHASKLLGLDVSRITVETADKALEKTAVALGASVSSGNSLTVGQMRL